MALQWRRGIYYFAAFKKHDKRESGGRSQNDLGEGDIQLSRVDRILPKSD